MPKKVDVDTYQIGDLKFIVAPAETRPEPKPAPAPKPVPRPEPVCPAPPCTPSRAQLRAWELKHGWGHGPTPRRDKTGYYVFD